MIVWELSGIVDVLAAREELARMAPGGYGVRLAMRPFVIGGMALIAWWRLFRTEAEGARVGAAFATVMLVLFSLVMWLNASVNGIVQPRGLSVGYPVVAIVFALYVVKGRER